MAGTVRYDAETGTYHAEYDWSEADPSMRVVEVVADALDRAAVEVPQLYETLDPDALDRLVGCDHGTPGEVSFEHAGCQVTVDAAGRVEVRVAER